MTDLLRERINIKDLSIEQPTKAETPFFDPEIDISPRAWEQAKSQLNTSLDSDQIPDYLAVYLMIILPKRRDELHLQRIEEDFFTNLAEKLTSRHSDVLEKTQSLVEGKIVYPQVFKRIKLDNAINFEDVESELDDLDQGVSWVDYFELATDIKILYPDRNIDLSGGARVELDKATDWESLGLPDPSSRDDLESYNEDLMNYTERMKQLRILDPQEFERKKIPPEAFEAMIKALEFWEAQEDWGRYFGLASDMQIIAAKKVNITSDNIEIIMADGKPLIEQIPPLPASRKF